ncbi:unnamed protein product [Leptosia nina]|uniref:Uncharacterized protein n=1 Tax=Leptosia nina TaxID=320188 RepID=A0AAV1JTK9_9NEOP
MKTRPHSTENRPKSANKKDELNPMQVETTIRASKFEREKLLPAQKETIKRCEDLEVHEFDSFDLQGSDHNFSDDDEESLTTRSERVVQLKMNWQEKTVQFEKMKSELKDQQSTILQVYASLQVTQKHLAKLGQDACLPTTEDLKIMNVANLTPAQLLQLCEESKRTKNEVNQSVMKDSFSIDMNKLNKIPMKLVETSKQILVQQQELTDWFTNIITQEKECGTRTLRKKMNEFNAKNEMLNSILHTSQNEFLTEVKDIMDFLRKCVNEAVNGQLCAENLTYEVSELNSKIIDLKRKLNNAEHLKSNCNKLKIDELEKELKEEKIKCRSLRDRLTRSDGQIKMEAEKAANLEAALSESRCHTRNLERTVLELKIQNERLQNDFDTELNKLNESIKENCVHLEEIADAREKLQSEKEDLEKRLEELSTHYNESLNTLKQELNNKVTQLIDMEKIHSIEVEEKRKLQGIVESQCAKLVEIELRNKDLTKRLQEREKEVDACREQESKLECVEEELMRLKTEIEHHKKRFLDQLSIIKEIEDKLKDSRLFEEKLKSDLRARDDYINTLEKKSANVEEKLEASESKMESYEEQLSSLKNHILQLQECFGDYESISDLREMLNKQKDKLESITRENHELAQTLQKRDVDVELLMEKELQLESDIKQRDDLIKVLSQKKEEQGNIIKLLTNNLENRSRVDSDLSRQLIEKNEEIDVLINNLETRKGQISQLEKIILTLEEQMRKASQQKRKDHERIRILEKQNDENKSYLDNYIHQTSKNPTKNLDSLFEILEDELGNSFDHQYEARIDFQNNGTKHLHNDIQIAHHGPQRINLIEHDSGQANTIVDDYEEIKPEPKKENSRRRHVLNREQFKTNMDTLEWAVNCDRNACVDINNSVSPLRDTPIEKIPKEKVIRRNLQLLPRRIREDRTTKMLNLTSHRL